MRQCLCISCLFWQWLFFSWQNLHSESSLNPWYTSIILVDILFPFNKILRHVFRLCISKIQWYKTDSSVCISMMPICIANCKFIQFFPGFTFRINLSVWSVFSISLVFIFCSVCPKCTWFFPLFQPYKLFSYYLSSPVSSVIILSPPSLPP